jgi:hypothetical protein
MSMDMSHLVSSQKPELVVTDADAARQNGQPQLVHIRRPARGLLAADPWFLRRPIAAWAVAATLFGGIFVARLSVGGPADVVSLLFMLPIALVAIAFGFRAGMLAGLLGTALVLAWTLAENVTLSPVGWASRATPMLLLGGLLGHAVDQLRSAEEDSRRLETAARRQRDAIEVNDTIVQGLAAAKWTLENNNATGALTIMQDTLQHSQQLVSELLREAEMGYVVHQHHDQPR